MKGFFSNEINLKPWPDDNRLRLCELLIRIKVPLNRLIVDPGAFIEDVFAAAQLLQFICNIMRWIKARGTSFCRHFVNDKSSRPRQPQQSLQKLPVLTKFSITGLEPWKKFRARCENGSGESAKTFSRNILLKRHKVSL